MSGREAEKRVRAMKDAVEGARADGESVGQSFKLGREGAEDER